LSQAAGGLRAVCVFCASRPGVDRRHLADATWLAQSLVGRGITLVYGGASVGLMGTLADAVLAAGGRAIGVIPRALVEREHAHPGLTESHVVETLHQRKQKMAELSDGFVVLPGGIGTLEEFFEILTWRALGLHDKPIGILDVRHYYADLLDFLDQGIADGFMDRSVWDLVQIATDPEHLLDVFEGRRPRRARDTDAGLDESLA
jgi:uncharacterized protein (TIGR00730 family)